MLEKRRAVGGLISLIGIVIVFGITSVAYLELSSSQTNLINTSINANQKISDRNNERLNFTSISGGGSQYTVNVDNLGSETITIHSQITKNGKTIVGKEEINDKIFAGTNKDVIVNLDVASSSGDKIIFITSLGKKCIVSEGVSFRVC
jgi:archaellum component FlaF (FlaF/FlaG flagellin family)